MIVLGVETSCDDTSVAILRDKKPVSNVIFSQLVTHKRFGGVVPELASRDHIKKISYVTQEALKKAGTSVGDIDGIAVTVKPGLIGALLVGLSFAKSLAYYNSIPFVGVNHVQAHLYSIFLEKKVPFPFIGLTVSGGHTVLTLVKDFMNEIPLGSTYDDAAGEAFDKVAKFMGLEYPGGPHIERLAKEGNPCAINFPGPLMSSKNPEDKYNFSFSGLKSPVINYLKKNPDVSRADVAASFQAAVVNVLSDRLRRATRDFSCKNIVLAGGVACNQSLRNRIFEIFNKDKYNIFIPSPVFCTDNAAMIAYAGCRLLERMEKDELSLGASSRL